MKISFDLDDLLIPGMKQFETHPTSFIHRFFKLEKIRKGTPDLTSVQDKEYPFLN